MEMLMGKIFFKKGFLLFVVCVLLAYPIASASGDDFDDDLFSDDLIEENPEVADPLEPLNRVFFQFNDKLYFWVLKPVAKTYGAILPDDLRMCLGNAFQNLLAPVRIVNNLLQGKISDSGVETARFLINTIAGTGGLGDPAKDVFKLFTKNEDLGQTLGKYGIGEGIYICWPILGPSNLRDTIGFVGDSFLNPLHYLALSDERAAYTLRAASRVNKTSLTVDDYDQFVDSALDPYSAMRDYYSQSRRSKIEDLVKEGKELSGHSQTPIMEDSSDLAGVGSGDNGVNNMAGLTADFIDLNNVEKMYDFVSSDTSNTPEVVYYSTNLIVETGIVGSLRVLDDKVVGI
jgi:phospholipid-binding lipoprotein MlaA